ncbi:serine hydrolase domain-containing protein [Streptomyces mangrovisoli]|uniref:Peptidase S12 n=1 Tax=Streptomyces mangrovisoli TaxID=1428628 RepID=A0A1J4NPZ1_9ACTN|nr:serine hydrolase domain-containing protein [Streptomyces mangrovisoli]OIJ64360.1 peptidase S12 [Streptomyces mangrovisoli]
MRPGTTPRPAPRRRLRLRRTCVAAGLVAASCLTTLHPAAAASAGGDRDLQRQLDQLVATPGGPPGAIVVLRDGHDRRVVRSGVGDVATGRSMRSDDHMRIASVAKAFSGAVALSLVDRHVLGLDDTLRKRLPQLPRAWGAVTLRELLNHTSGLPDYSADPDFLAIVTADPHHHFDSRRLLDFVADQPLNFRPGSRYQYSNSDNIAVALMAEAATRRTYESLLSELVYRPLALHDTSLPQDWRMPQPYIHGYDVVPPAPPEDISEALSASGVWASGGIVSTPNDLNRFVRGYAGGALYGPRVVRAQRTWIDGDSGPAGPGRNQAGLALFRYTTRCGVVLGHTGNFPGYTQFAAATPDGSRSITFSINTQINESKPELLSRLRTVEENFVCSLLRHDG